MPDPFKNLQAAARRRGKLTDEERAERELRKDRHSAVRVCGVPTKIKPGRVLYHNHVMHTKGMGHGLNGFRCWTLSETNSPLDGFAPCPCGWSGLPHLALIDHIKATKGKAMTIEQMVKAGAFIAGPHMDELIAEERAAARAACSNIQENDDADQDHRTPARRRGQSTSRQSASN
jgi:hypothetical protein